MAVKAVEKSVFKMRIPFLALNSFIRNYKFRKRIFLRLHFYNTITPAENPAKNSVAILKLFVTTNFFQRPGSKCNFLRHWILNRAQRHSLIVFIIENIRKNIALTVKRKGIHCKIHWNGFSLTFNNLSFRHNADAVRRNLRIYKRHAAMSNYDITFFNLFAARFKAEPAAGKNSSLCNKFIIYKRKNIFRNVKNFWGIGLCNFYTACP